MRVQMPINTPKQRSKIYKKVLELVEKDEVDGLCIDLKEQSGRSFQWRSLPETDVLFPEFGKHMDFYTPIKWVKLYESNIKAWRKKVLRACIEMCN